MASTDVTFATGYSRLITGMTAMLRFHQSREKIAASPQGTGGETRRLPTSVHKAFEQHVANKRKVLSHDASYALIEEFGLPVAPQRLVSSASEAAQFADSAGYPLVAKIVNSEAATHKTELGAIFTGIKTKDELASAVTRLLDIVKQHKLEEDGQPV